MGSACEVVLASSSDKDAQRLAQMAISEVIRIERKYSRYIADSVVSHVNQQAGVAPVACDDETWALLQYAAKLHEQSGGMFDITSGVLRQVWNFQLAVLPPKENITAVLAKVGWHKVQLQNQSVFLPDIGMEIDLGGFGKEYAADRAAQVLQAQGVKSGHVNLAGDMRFLGPKSTGEPWMIGIQDPRHSSQVIATLPMMQGGLATSGDYERFFELDGQRYCHVINPLTGWPVTYWRSVSVTAPATVVAGCTSTMAMLMEERGLSFLQATGFDFLAMDYTGKVHMRQ
jgi:thiamine biosynthesis lipoprotein